jgi:hypothetical protein
MRVGTWRTVATSAAVMASIVGCAAREVATPPPPVAASTVTEEPGRVLEENVVSVAATVVAVDQKKRVVKLRDSEGKDFDITVGPEVKNLAQVKKGDSVVATYYESMAITVRKPGEVEPGAAIGDVVGRADPGEKPAGAAATQTTIVATVVGLNKGKGTVTVKGPGGKVVTVPARDPKRLEHVKVGDLLEVVYTEAVAISVEKTPAK